MGKGMHWGGVGFKVQSKSHDLKAVKVFQLEVFELKSFTLWMSLS